MQAFNQISYAVDNFPTQSATDTGQNVYNPIEGSFIIGTRSVGFDGFDTPIYIFPIGDFSNEALWTFTNLEILLNSANISSDVVSSDYDFLVKIFCTRRLPFSNTFSASDYELLDLGNDVWDLSNMLSFFTVNNQFTLSLGSSEVTNLGLYKGTFLLF